MSKFRFLLAFVALFVLAACSKEEYNINRKNAMLVYCASANSLESDIWKNVEEIRKSYYANSEKDIYIFFKKVNSESILYKTVRKSTGNKLVEVKRYPVATGTADTKTLDMVMSDLDTRADVIDITDVLFSSHASSWLPNIYVDSNLSDETPPSANKSRGATEFSFGQDITTQYSTMYIDDMALVLEKYNLNSIIFDACYMSSIEVFYQFRNSAKHILASPAEVISTGMNYAAIAPHFTGEITLEKLGLFAQENYNMYNKPDGELFDCGTFTVANCLKLEALGAVIKNITMRYGTPENNIAATPSTMIRYDGLNGVGKDYKQYLYNLIEMFGVESDKIALDAAWKEAFPYYFHTDKLFGWPMAGSCGVGGYIYRNSLSDSFNNYYLTLDWGKFISNK